MKPDAGTQAWLGRPCGAGNPVSLAYMYMWAELATITQAFSGSSLAAPHSTLHDPQNIENWNVPGSRNLSGVLLIKKEGYCR